MKIVFKLFGQMRSVVGNLASIELEFDQTSMKLIEALKTLANNYPEIGELLFTEDKIHSFYNIMVNGQSVIHETLSSYILTDQKNEISILPFVAGG